MKPKEFGGLLKAAASAWLEDNAPRLGAALAYYTVFSLAPLLLIAIGIAGLIFGQGAAQDQAIGQIQNVVGEEGGKAIRTILENASRPGSGIVGGLLSVAMLLFGAISLFSELQDALNTIWKVPPKPGLGVWRMIRDRLWSFAMVLVLAVLLLASLILSTVLAVSAEYFGQWQVGIMGHVVNEIVSLMVLTLLFAMIFRILPDVPLTWADVWLGAFLTALLVDAGKFVIGQYLGRSGVASAYGAAGSLAVLLVWLYYSGQIFYFGVEFTKVYAHRCGSRLNSSTDTEPCSLVGVASRAIPVSTGAASQAAPTAETADS